MPVGVMVGPGVATVRGGATTATAGAGVVIDINGDSEVADGGAVVVIEVTGGAGVAAGGAGVVIEVTGSAGVAAGGAGVVVEVTVGAGAADGDHKRNFDATATTTMTAQITAPRPASNFHSFHVGIVGGAINFRLWRVTPAPALSRSSSRICRGRDSSFRSAKRRLQRCREASTDIRTLSGDYAALFACEWIPPTMKHEMAPARLKRAAWRV